MPPKGPLTVHTKNPRYFADPDGNPVYLTGSHTWAALQERRYEHIPLFDYDRYLDFMVAHGHNFLRMWSWEHSAWMQFTDQKVLYSPNRYMRTGPGNALDGLPKFDVTRFDPVFFERLRERVQKAGEKEIYVSLMMFQGFSVEQKDTSQIDPKIGNQWLGHPFHPQNNINGINGDPNNTGRGTATHRLEIPEIIALQETYVRKVIDTLNDFGHVLWEIANEPHEGSVEWQYHFIRFIKEYESTKPKQHLVGMTGYPVPTRIVFQSPADWVSPGPEGDFKYNPLVVDLAKPVVADTDHFNPWGYDPVWVWKAFVRGHHPIIMDEYMDVRQFPNGTDQPAEKWEAIRHAMGQTRVFAKRMDLTEMTPQPLLASSGYCLANPGHEYLVYLPQGGSVDLDLSDAKGELALEWFNPTQNKIVDTKTVLAEMKVQFKAPFEGHAVLYLKA